MRIAYLNLQAAVEGQASFAHVHRIVDGLRALGTELDLYEPDSRTPHKALARVGAILGAQLRLLPRIGRYEALYIRAHHLAWLTVVIARLENVPVVLEVNGFYDDLYAAWPPARALRWVFDAMLRGCMRGATRIIAVTDSMAAWSERESRGVPSSVIPNAADVEAFHPGLARHPDAPSSSYALFFGALAPWQGIDVVLRARASAEWPADVELVIAGVGRLQDAVQTAAASGQVSYLGAVPHARIGGLIAHALCSLVPMTDSDRSCSPVKLYESLACGVPVVVSDIEGLSDVVSGCGCAEVVQPNDAAAIARAVTRIGSDNERAAAMGRAARTLAVQKHSWTERARATADVLRDAVESAKVHRR